METGPMAEGKPFALGIEFAPDDKPGGELGGTIQAGGYMTSGVRLMVTRDLRPVVGCGRRRHQAGNQQHLAVAWGRGKVRGRDMAAIQSTSSAGPSGSTSRRRKSAKL
jgi:hypothetical protein